VYPAAVVPETRYVRTGDIHLAYQTVGDGPIDMVLVDQWFSNMDGQWDVAPVAELRRRLAASARLILFDKRGVGLSDPVSIRSLPSIETWMDDLRAVLDAVGSERTALVTNLGGSLMTFVFAATHPDRLSSVVVVDGFARVLAAPDYPFGQTVEEKERVIQAVADHWGRGFMLDMFAPSARGLPGLREAWSRFERASGSPGVARAMIRNILELDVREVLPSIRVPTLIVHHGEAVHYGPEYGRYLAEHIAGARYVELPGPDQLMWAGDQGPVVAEIEAFVTGVRPSQPSSRVLATVLFTDIVDSTRRAAELGDRAWRTLLEEHDRLARRAIDDAAGRAIKSTGDGVLATFDGPARAVRAARGLSDAVRGLGLHIRAGLHAREIEVGASDIAGLAVHIGSRVAALAGPDEVLVTGTVRDLVMGSGIEFEPRGSRILKGVPGRWRLYAASRDLL
jgi:class 3 adenylate cyclase